VVDRVGRVLGTQAFPDTAAGYQAALAWMNLHGELAMVGVEGTGSYGAGLARYLASCGIEVAEVIRPNRQARRQRGKSDAADAAAAAALSGEASGMPKSRDGAPSPSGRCGWPGPTRSRPAPRPATSCAT
jgi:transposase